MITRVACWRWTHANACMTAGSKRTEWWGQVVRINIVSGERSTIWHMQLSKVSAPTKKVTYITQRKRQKKKREAYNQPAINIAQAWLHPPASQFTLSVSSWALAYQAVKKETGNKSFYILYENEVYKIFSGWRKFLYSLSWEEDRQDVLNNVKI